MTAAARTSSHGQTRTCYLAAPLLAAGCAMSPEAFERANIRDGSVLPRSSASALTGAFDAYCAPHIAGSANTRQELRKDAYVPLVSGPAQRLQGYIVDNSKPAVFLSKAGAPRHCAVVAKSRTGQSARFAEHVRTQYPQAEPARAADYGVFVEAAWRQPDAGTLIYTYRDGPLRQPSLYGLGIIALQSQPKEN